MSIEELKGKTLTEIKVDYTEARITFYTITGDSYIMWHQQDCCEGVNIKEIVGDIEDLIGTPILEAEEVTNSEDLNGLDYRPESFTWTFYKLGTTKGHVTISWLGSSNGYYSESVNFDSIN